MINIATRIDNSEKAKAIRSFRKLMRPKPRLRLDKLIEKIILPIVAYLFMIVFWPAMVIWVAKDRLERRATKNRVIPEPEVFKVKKEHLKEKVSIEEIKLKEMVTDPLDAVPTVSFGHLNSAWQEFKGKLQPDDELWIFSAQWALQRGGKKNYTGYVFVQAGVPSEYFTVRVLDIKK